MRRQSGNRIVRTLKRVLLRAGAHWDVHKGAGRGPVVTLRNTATVFEIAAPDFSED